MTLADGTQKQFSLFREDKDTFEMSMSGGDSVTLRRRADAAPENFAFYSAEELMNMGLWPRVNS